MVRAPCCQKVGLKKGPWSPEEDRILASYILRYGHGNWRALPRHAGLLRCGKSCRLRWMNYLSPDIKRGDFSREEEQTIIKLHEALGNRWSAIAARLPGRTDNEIKNVWHTHLKKKLNQPSDDTVVVQKTSDQLEDVQMVVSSTYINDTINEDKLSSPQSSTISDGDIISNCDNNINNFHNNHTNYDNDVTIMTGDSPTSLISEFDDTFWWEAFSSETDDSNLHSQELQLPMLESSYEQNDMDFWFNVLSEAGDLSELLQDELFET